MRLPVSPRTKIIDLTKSNTKVYSGPQLETLVSAVTLSLTKLNLPAGSQIALIGRMSVPFLTTVLGIFNTSHCAVPVNYKLPPAQVTGQLGDTKIQFVFYDAEFLDLVPAGVQSLCFDQFDSFLDPGEFDIAAPDPERDCLIMHTSGSTGVPKKIVISYKDYCNNINNCRYDHNVGIRHMSAGLTFHPSGLTQSLIQICCGSEIFLRPQFDARQLLNDVAKYKIQQVAVVTPMMSMMLQHQDLLSKLNFDQVKIIRLLSSYCNVNTLKTIQHYFPNAQIQNLYGLTETGAPVFWHHPQGVPTPLGSAGYPSPQFDIKLIDHVLHIKTSTLKSNYRIQIKEEYFNTKDMFTVDEKGFYYYMGRADDMFKNGGEKVYPIEIESVLGQHSNVLDVVAVGLPDDIKGHKPYAFVIVNNDIDESELLKYAAQNLATYQIPKRIWVLQQFPLNAIGKIDRRQLQQLAESLNV